MISIVSEFRSKTAMLHMIGFQLTFSVWHHNHTVRMEFSIVKVVHEYLTNGEENQ